jgi:hypothetical protein
MLKVDLVHRIFLAKELPYHALLTPLYPPRHLVPGRSLQL